MSGIRRLTDLQLKAWLKTTGRTPKKLFDGDGLYVTTTPAGTAVWRLRYRFGGADRTLALGTHDDLGLRGAREACERARGQLLDGRDPFVARQVDRAEKAAASGMTFAVCAAEWLQQRKPGWSRPHFETVEETLERHVLPTIGSLPVAEISPAIMALLVERLNDRIDTAQKVRGYCVGVFRLAMARGKIPHGAPNPADASREVIPRRRKQEHYPALLTWPELGDVLRRARAAHLSPSVAQAHRLCAYTTQRLGNVITARWEQFDLDAGTWTIPRQQMKVSDRPFDHVVFLPAQIVDDLRVWQLVRGEGFLFPAPRSGHGDHITLESVEKVYRVTLGLKGKHVPHGWRSAFSTLARDAGHDRDAVEMALDHVHDTNVARAYDRGERRDLRVQLAAWWGAELAAAEASR